MNKKILLSVMITCYNEEKYIQKCIESVINQMDYDFEVLIVDDCSTDSSLQLIHDYKDKVRIISLSKNNGLSFARNVGIDCSNGDYLLFLDGDDYLSFNVLKDIKDKLLSNRPDVLFGLVETIKEADDDDARWKEPVIDNPNYFDGLQNGKLLLHLFELKMKLPPAQRYIVRKEFIDNINLRFELVSHEDELWTPQVLCLAQSISFLCRPIFVHRIKKFGLGNKFEESDIESYMYICRKLLTFANTIPDVDKVKFLYLRCKYNFEKVLRHMEKWENGRRERCLKRIKSDIHEIQVYFDHFDNLFSSHETSYL